MTNQEKYARNLAPDVPATRQDTLSISSGSGSSSSDEGETASDDPGVVVMHYTYTRNKLALADITFQVEWSESLAANDWHATGVTEEILADDGSVQQVRATVPIGSATRRFVRLKMTRQ